MTRSELAKDKLYCWELIDRSRKVGFHVPEKWLRHGEPPEDPLTILNVVMDSYLDDLWGSINKRSPLYDLLS